MNTEILGVITQIILMITLSYPLGKYIAKVYKGNKVWSDFMNPVENLIFRLSGIHTALFSPFSAIELSIRRIDELFEIVEKTAMLESIQEESRVLLDKFGYETYKKYDALLQDALDLCKYFNEGIDTSDQEVYNKNIASYLVNIKSLLLDIKKKYQNL